MTGSRELSHLAERAAAFLVIAALFAGCARADKNEPASSSSMHMSTTRTAGRSGSMNMTTTTPKQETMSAMGMETGNASIDGIKPVPIQTLGSATWEGMKITARAMTPVPFVVFNGTSERMVKPGNASFHLMVMLNDAHTGVAIPYASVWATIRKDGKIISDARQWPMLARYMGPHYGNDVTVPGAGTYQLSLLISPPVSARHIEYQHV
jgi:hypothetical protein